MYNLSSNNGHDNSKNNEFNTAKHKKAISEKKNTATDCFNGNKPEEADVPHLNIDSNIKIRVKTVFTNN